MDNKKNTPFSSLTGFPLVYGDELDSTDLDMDLGQSTEEPLDELAYLKPTEIYERRVLKPNFQRETPRDDLTEIAASVTQLTPSTPLTTPSSHAQPAPLPPASLSTPAPMTPDFSSPTLTSSYIPPAPPAAPTPINSNYTPPSFLGSMSTPAPTTPAVDSKNMPDSSNVNQEVAQSFQKSQEIIANGIAEFRNTQKRAQDYLDQLKAEISLEAQELKMLDHKIKQLKPQHEIPLLIDQLSSGTIKYDDVSHLLESEKHIFQQRNCSLAAQRLTELSKTTFDNAQRIKETIGSLNQEMAIIGIQSEKIAILQSLKNKAQSYKMMTETKADAESDFLEMASFLNGQRTSFQH